MNVFLWIIQILLALLFLFAGGTKVVLPIETLTAQAPPNSIQFPAMFIRFIGLCEFLGALGLILPGIFRIKTFLTPLAALGLTIILLGAVAVTVAGPGASMAVAPLVFALLSAFVAYGRSKLAPHPERR